MRYRSRALVARVALLGALGVCLGLQAPATAGAGVTLDSAEAHLKAEARSINVLGQTDQTDDSSFTEFNASVAANWSDEAGSASASSALDAVVSVAAGQLRAIESKATTYAIFDQKPYRQILGFATNQVVLEFTVDSPVDYSLQGSLSASDSMTIAVTTTGGCAWVDFGDLGLFGALAPLDHVSCIGDSKTKKLDKTGTLAPGSYAIYFNTDADAGDGNASAQGNHGTGASQSDIHLLFDPKLLTVQRAGRGVGTVTSTPSGINCGLDCTESYKTGASVTLHAAPVGDSRFTGWSGACTGTSATCTVGMGADRTAVATFRRKHQPDGQIKLQSDKTFLGDNAWNLPGAQTRSTSQTRSHSRTFNIKLQNDGVASDKIGVKGCGSTPGFAVQYLDGTKDVTKQVVGGTYFDGPIANGAARIMNLKVVVGPNATVGATKSCPVTLSSAAVPTRKDVVTGRVKVAAG